MFYDVEWKHNVSTLQSSFNISWQLWDGVVIQRYLPLSWRRVTTIKVDSIPAPPADISDYLWSHLACVRTMCTCDGVRASSHTRGNKHTQKWTIQVNVSPLHRSNTTLTRAPWSLKPLMPVFSSCSKLTFLINGNVYLRDNMPSSSGGECWSLNGGVGGGGHSDPAVPRYSLSAAIYKWITGACARVAFWLVISPKAGRKNIK